MEPLQLPEEPVVRKLGEAKLSKLTKVKPQVPKLDKAK